MRIGSPEERRVCPNFRKPEKFFTPRFAIGRTAAESPQTVPQNEKFTEKNSPRRENLLTLSYSAFFGRQCASLQAVARVANALESASPPRPAEAGGTGYFRPYQLRSSSASRAPSPFESRRIAYMFSEILRKVSTSG